MKEPRIRLSQCMIVKNEEKNIERALSWGKGIVCEQIVVDTGSSDRTAEIARNMGAKVFSFPWSDDFSAAKNYALEQASGNWIAFLDADEYFGEEDAERLLPLLKDISKEPGIDLLQVKMLHMEDDGTVISASGQIRIFRNRKELRYRYPIHEELYEKGRTLSLCDAQEYLTIIHTGYGKSSLESANKGERNIQILKKSLEEYPGDAMLLVYLGDAYVVSGDEESAAAYYRMVLEQKRTHPDQVREWAYLRAAFQLMTYLINQREEAIQKEIYPICCDLKENGYGMHPDVDLFLGIRSLNRQNYEKALILLESALEKLKIYKGNDDTHISGMLDVVYQWLAAIYYERKNNPEKAVQQATTALRLNKYADRATQTLFQAFSAELGEGADVEPYWQFLSKVYDFGNQKDMLYLYKHAKLSNFVEFEKKLWRELPEELRIELGGTYEKDERAL